MKPKAASTATQPAATAKATEVVVPLSELCVLVSVLLPLPDVYEVESPASTDGVFTDVRAPGT
uniref:Uncharacterized protein n=1 Tax=Globisporangium ultimum (strain ATCC 200006 / CBS 805.95 / DAOM BR144) TaxID=431595 RepID=K3WPC8_GLOUD